MVGMSDTEKAGLTIRWGTLTTVLTVMLITALGTLAVVVSIKDVDVLSTVALALAVLAFAAQLIVTMIQSAQAASLSASTAASLAEIRTAADSLLVNQRGTMDRLLDAVIPSVENAVENAGAESGMSGDDVEALKRAVNVSLSQAAAAAQASSTAREVDRWRINTLRSGAEAADALDIVMTRATDPLELAAAREEVSRLSGAEVETARDAVMRYLRSFGEQVGFRYPTRGAEFFASKGWAERRGNGPITLTKRGELVVRVLLGDASFPAR